MVLLMSPTPQCPNFTARGGIYQNESTPCSSMLFKASSHLNFGTLDVMERILSAKKLGCKSRSRAAASEDRWPCNLLSRQGRYRALLVNERLEAYPALLMLYRTRAANNPFNIRGVILDNVQNVMPMVGYQPVGKTQYAHW